MLSQKQAIHRGLGDQKLVARNRTATVSQVSTRPLVPILHRPILFTPNLNAKPNALRFKRSPFSAVCQAAAVAVNPAHPTDEAEPQVDTALLNRAGSGVGFAFGDVLAQALTGDSFNALRSVELGLYGFAIEGPAKKLLNRIQGNTDDGAEQAKPLSPRSKHIDNLIWAPLTACLFFGAIKLLEGQPEEILQTCQDKVLSMMVANYVLWPVAQFVNSQLVPAEHRQSCNHLITIMWSSWLAMLGHQPFQPDSAHIQAFAAGAHTAMDRAVSAIGPHVSHAMDRAVSGFIGNHHANHAVAHAFSPFAHKACDMVQAATQQITHKSMEAVQAIHQFADRLPSTALEKVFSKSLDEILPTSQMERSPSELLELPSHTLSLARQATRELPGHCARGMRMMRQATTELTSFDRLGSQMLVGC